MKWNPDRNTFVVALFCGALVLLSMSVGQRGGSACALLPFDAPSAAPAELPTAWTLTDLEGSVHRASDYDGAPYVVSFWTTWCPNCRREMPELVALDAAVASSGVKVLSISLDEGPPEALRSFAARHELTFPVLQTDAASREAFAGAVRAVPTTLVFGPGHQLLGHFEGVVKREELTSLLEPWLKESGHSEIAARR